MVGRPSGAPGPTGTGADPPLCFSPSTLCPPLEIPIETLDPFALVQLAGVTLVAALTQGVVGFGFTLFAVSFFLLIIQSGDAVHLMIIINFAISLALLPKVRRDVDWPLWRRLAVGALVGLPLGVVAFNSADVDQLKILAGVTILTFVAITVSWRPDARTRPSTAANFRSGSALGVGAVAGGMTTALGMPGPAIVLYLTAVGMRKNAVRSTTLTFFAVSYGTALLLQAATIGVGTGVWIAAAILVPVAAVGALLGHVLSPRLSEAAFRKVVLIFVAATGCYVLFDTLVR